MCGRYVRRSDKQQIAELFAIHGPVMPDFGPSWNVAPRTFQPVVRLNRDTGEREIVLMRWGLIPKRILLANSGCAAEVSDNQTFQAARTFAVAMEGQQRYCLLQEYDPELFASEGGK